MSVNSTRFKPTHGMSDSPTYSSYMAMMKRCNNPNDKEYSRYGAKGIRVCDSWMRGFVEFYKDMGERPSGCTLDRINNKKGYSKSNCRWATHREQVLNRDYSLNIEIDGVVKHVSEWSKISGIPIPTIASRIRKGKIPKLAVFASVDSHQTKATLNGVTKPIKEWAKDYGVQTQVIKHRLKVGWSDEKAITTPVRARRKNDV